LLPQDRKGSPRKRKRAKLPLLRLRLGKKKLQRTKKRSNPFLVFDFGFRLPARVRNNNPAHRRSRKSRPGVRGHAAQHRIYGRRPVGSAVWIGLGKIGKMGCTLSEMWSCASGQTFELHESQRVSSVRSCAVLQN